jgi:hypothetical protein
MVVLSFALDTCVAGGYDHLWTCSSVGKVVKRRLVLCYMGARGRYFAQECLVIFCFAVFC